MKAEEMTAKELRELAAQKEQEEITPIQKEIDELQDRISELQKKIHAIKYPGMTPIQIAQKEMLETCRTQRI